MERKFNNDWSEFSTSEEVIKAIVEGKVYWTFIAAMNDKRIWISRNMEGEEIGRRIFHVKARG